ncbi:hypothetical protein D7V97_16880 [Corallococcus sp. CA053C]|uniref:hypothetical protein n=1 Tax=Corallococcus sp. CA053C TaxID=2316732 RepID=UPI000EA04510|nr:hypothetical protein [Corallococcus sp. CA053C]RKH09303.1 hypothetical protein D7V97_16880 [Corallococcus sp. CA053C]
MRTLPTLRSFAPGRASRLVAFLLALTGVLLPKCPLCIAVYLSAAGLGASAAHAVAPAIIGAGRMLVALAVGVLSAWVGMRLWRGWRGSRRRIV